MKNLILSGILFCMLISMPAFSQGVAKPPAHRVVMQMTSSDTLVHKSLINQLNALREYWQDDVAIEVVMHGPGVDMALSKKTTQQSGIEQMKAGGVKFIVCENTLRLRKINKEDLLPGLEYVPYGQVHIITRQEKGWSYIKVGF